MNVNLQEEATTLEARACPICDSASSEVLYRQRFAQFSAGSIGDGYDVVACTTCGMVFASGLPDPGRFARYYADSSKYDLGADGAQLLPNDVARYANQAAFVASHVLDKSTPVLDVGTAAGGFLLALRDHGFTSPYGVEPSPDAVRVAREHFGLEVVVGGLEAAGSFGLQFGLISYVAVLEHVLDPREQLRAVSRLLRPGGYLFVCVPDAGGFKNHVDAPFQEFSVEHINFFTAQSLVNALGAEGYALVGQRSVVLTVGTDSHGPALDAIYRWDGELRSPHPDPSGPQYVRQYVQGCEAVEHGLRARIARMADSGERIYVWGTGTHTLHLLQTSRLAECAIEAFLDLNPHYAGTSLAGRPVVSPTDLRQADAPILVSSAVSQSGIAAAARERFGVDVPLILLY